MNSGAFSINVDNIGAHEARIVNRQRNSDAAPPAGFLHGSSGDHPWYRVIYDDTRDRFDIAPMRSGSMSLRNYGDREHEFPPLGANGVFHADRIPGLDAAKITTGTFDADRIPAGTGNANSAAYAGGFPQASAQREGQLAIDLESLVAAICTNIPHVTAIATGTFGNCHPCQPGSHRRDFHC